MKRPNSRSELFSFLEDRMNQTYTTLLDEQELDTSLLKTYMLEAHLPENSDNSDVEKYLKNIEQNKLDSKITVNVDSTKDSSLYRVESIIKKELTTLYLDTSNTRFWIIHSINKSTAIDWLMERLIRENQGLDHAWIWPELLHFISKEGSFRGLGLDYDRRPLPDIDFEDPESMEYLKLQLWGMQAENVLNILNKSFPNTITLSKIKVKYCHNIKKEDDFSIDDIKYDGKITARGTSFQSHITLVDKLYRKYSGIIRKIESEYTIKVENRKGSPIAISGEAMCIKFSKPIKYLDKFCAHLFTSSLPFRLWGVPILEYPNQYSVSGLDLHSNSRIDMDITPEYIRLFIPPESCGNSIVRLFTNLKHYYDSNVILQNGDRNDIL